MKHLQTTWIVLSQVFRTVFSEPVLLPFTGFLLITILRCVRLARALLTQAR
jgi:hypothetical protein